MKMTRVLLPLFLLAPWLCGQTYRERTDAIVSAMQNREFARALHLLAAALQDYPADAQLWTMQGKVYEEQGRNPEALRSFRKAVQISPDYLPALEGEAQIKFAAADVSAIPVIEHILRLHPEDQTGHAMLAVLEYQQGNCAKAVPQFAKAGHRFDAQPGGLHAYAACLVKLKQFDQAAGVFARSLELNPSDGHERRLLAALQIMAHKPQDALTTLQPLLQSAGTDAETLELAATAYEDSKDTPQAVDRLRQAILLDPQNVNLYLDFANISSTHDSFQVGINVVTDGIGQLPKAAPLYLARGVLHVQLAEYDAAQSDFETAHQLDPRQSLSSAAQGVLAAQKDDLNGALAEVQAKLAKRANDPLLLYLQADFLSQKGIEPGTPEFDLAMRSARKAVALQPGLAGARTVLAKLEMQTGEYAQAVEQCRKALESDPKNQTALYHLIQALRKTGDKGEIPDLLKRLALLRKQSAHEESERYRYKLVEQDAQPQPAAPSSP